MSGTVVAFEFNRFIGYVAADSRAFDNGGVFLNDCQGKITVVNGGTVAAFAGICWMDKVDGPNGQKIPWWHVKSELLSLASKDPKAPLETLVDAWQERMRELLTECDQEYLAYVYQEFKKRPAIQGVFLNYNEANRPKALVVEISVLETASGLTVVSETNVIDSQESFGVVGFNELSLQMDEQTADGIRWQETLCGLSARDRVIRVVELTSRHFPESAGGPVDAVSISKDGVKWLRRKPGCPES